MIGVFKKKNPGNVLMLFIIGALLKIPVFRSAEKIIANDNDGILYQKLVKLLEPLGNAFPVVYALIAYLIIILEAIILSQFINANRLMKRSNFLAGLAFVLITSFLPEFNYLSSQLIASLFFLLIFIQMFKSHNQQLTTGGIYNSGLTLGIAVLLFFPSLFFLLWMFIALVLFRPFQLKEWILMMMGLLTPYYFLASYFFLTDQSLMTLLPQLSFGFNKEAPSIWLAGTFFLVLTPLLTGFYYSQSLSNRMLIHARKAWTLFLIFILVSIIIVFFNPTAGYENWILVLLPVAAFHGFGYLNSEVNIYPKISFWLSVVFIIFSQVYLNIH